MPVKPPVLESSFSLYCTMLRLSPPLRGTMFNSASACALAARGLCSVAAAAEHGARWRLQTWL